LRIAFTRTSRSAAVSPDHEFRRFCLGFAAAATIGAFLLPFGRPGPRLTGAPPPTSERISFSAFAWPSACAAAMTL